MPKPYTLAAFDSGSKLDAKNLPARLLVVPWGESKTRKGLVVCGAKTLAEMPGRQRAEKFDRVALDFNHNTAKDGPEPKPVAGFGTPEIVEGEGVYLSAIEYTDEGRRLLAGGHYPDISPAVLRDPQGEVLFLHSVGACRQGEIDGLTLFSAGDGPELSCFEAVDEDDPDAADDGNRAASELRAVVVGLINAIDPGASLAEDASDGDIATAARAAAEKLAGGEGDGGDAAPVAMAAGEELLGKIVALEAKFEARERESLIAEATRAGKVVPLSADEIAGMSLTTLSSLVSGLPVTVPTESRLGGAIDNFAATPGGGITPELREVAAQLGLDPADLV